MRKVALVSDKPRQLEKICGTQSTSRSGEENERLRCTDTCFELRSFSQVSPFFDGIRNGRTVQLYIGSAAGSSITLCLKVHCHAIQCFYVDFFAVENGGEETRGRGAGQRFAGLDRTFFSSPVRIGAS